MFNRNTSLLVFLLLICIFSRVISSVYYIEDIDSLRFALSIKEFDIVKLQPHFPGYPIFCFLVKFLHFVIGNMGISFSIIGGTSIFFIIYYLLRMFSTSLKSYEGQYIALIVFLNPLFWLMSNRYMPDLMGLSISIGAIYYLIYANRQGRHLEKGFFLSGLLAGVRLSYLPLLILPLLKIFFSSNDKRQKLAIYFFSGVFVWLIPMVLVTGFNDLIIMAEKQTFGHFMDFGGTIFTEQSLFDRFVFLFKSVWADGFGGYWTSRSFSSILLSLLLIVQFITSIKDITEKWEHENKIKPLILCVAIYFIWILLFQNVIYKSRHVLPIILFLCILLIEGQEKYRGKIYSGIIYVYFIILLNHNAILIKQHQNFTAIQKLKNYISASSDVETIVSIPLINYYLQSHQIKADFIDVKENADIESLSFEKIESGRVLMVGDYRSSLLDIGLRFSKDTIFYHNPYMNQMWSKIMTYKVEKLFKNETY